jgi:hypothetical protein
MYERYTNASIKLYIKPTIMKYCRCGNSMPQARIDLGYNKCVQCSDTQLYSYVPIIANKQVLEVQIVDQATSANVHRAWRRK